MIRWHTDNQASFLQRFLLASTQLLEAKCRFNGPIRPSFSIHHPEVTVTHINCIANFLAHTWRVLIRTAPTVLRWYLVNLHNFYIRNPSCNKMYGVVEHQCQHTRVTRKPRRFVCPCLLQMQPIQTQHNSRRRPKAKEASTRLTPLHKCYITNEPSTRSNRDTAHY